MLLLCHTCTIHKVHHTASPHTEHLPKKVVLGGTFFGSKIYTTWYNFGCETFAKSVLDAFTYNSQPFSRAFIQICALLKRTVTETAEILISCKKPHLLYTLMHVERKQMCCVFHARYNTQPYTQPFSIKFV